MKNFDYHDLCVCFFLFCYRISFSEWRWRWRKNVENKEKVEKEGNFIGYNFRGLFLWRPCIVNFVHWMVIGAFKLQCKKSTFNKFNYSPGGNKWGFLVSFTQNIINKIIVINRKKLILKIAWMSLYTFFYFGWALLFRVKLERAWTFDCKWNEVFGKNIYFFILLVVKKKRKRFWFKDYFLFFYTLCFSQINTHIKCFYNNIA